jgi:hypothetical protein
MPTHSEHRDDRRRLRLRRGSVGYILSAGRADVKQWHELKV